jgi:hypothetical protein
MGGDLFVSAQDHESLDTFARRMARLLELARLERRESSNYVEGEYYSASTLCLVVMFARADEVDLENYDFWIHLRPTGAWVDDRSFLDGLADLLARRMTIAGENVVRLPEAEREGGRKVFYNLNPDAPHASKEQVTTTEVQT